jgi:hypothetical protein
VIQEYERPHHAALGRGQYAPHVEFAEAAHARLDRELDGVRRRVLLSTQHLVVNSAVYRKA